MKKLLLFLLLIPSLLMGQNQKGTLKISPYEFVALTARLNTITLTPSVNNFLIDRDDVVIPLPASASITITITDTAQVPLSDIRDTLCIAWGYNGAPNDNAAKLAFLKQFLVNKIVNDYGSAKSQAAANSALSIVNQVNVQ